MPEIITDGASNCFTTSTIAPAMISPTPTISLRDMVSFKNITAETMAKA
ncbi:MAG: hypothetical protein KIT80_21525 [Chitinophagaceae bacterium]|nr:hypothetical protein [Chitinophagaceae bacterium]MCW5929515.1 hypothetical protein [Chitinophagaceae bacterium]